MPRPLKIIQLGLEDIVADARRAGRTLPEAVGECNQALLDRHKGKGTPASVSLSAVKRYWEKLPAHVVPALHEPQRAAENATLAVQIVPRLNLLDQLLGEWLQQAAIAGKPVYGVMWDPIANKPIAADSENTHAECVEVYTADWHARGTMAREMREFLKAVTDLLERIYDTQQVQQFQEAVMDTIREVDPLVAVRVTAALQAKRTARASAVLGTAHPL